LEYCHAVGRHDNTNRGSHNLRNVEMKSTILVLCILCWILGIFFEACKRLKVKGADSLTVWAFNQIFYFGAFILTIFVAGIP